MLNLDVITHVITWFITLVADHEHVKRELRDEVAANKDNLLEYLSKTDTHLHRCFVKSMRIRPFAGKPLFFTSSPSTIFGQTREIGWIQRLTILSVHDWGILVRRQKLPRGSGEA